MWRTVLVMGLVAVCVLMIATVGQPMPVGVIESDSMAPTLERGDAFLALPPALVDGVDVGDVVVFAGDEGWTVHRVAERVDEGYLTAGDANPFVDQAAAEPTVSRGAIAGVVPTVGDTPVAIPAVGGYLSSWVWIVVGIVAIGLALGGGSAGPTPRLGPLSIGALAGVVVVASWVWGTDGAVAGRDAIVHNTGLVPTVVFVDGARGGSTALLLPGDSLPVTGAESVSTAIGWAPRALLRWLPAEPVAVVALTAACSAGLTAAVVASITWTTRIGVGR